MKDKKEFARGIIMCARGSLLDAFALYASIPLLLNLLFGEKLYEEEKTVAILSLAIWIGVSIGSTIVIKRGMNRIFEYCSISSAEKNIFDDSNKLHGERIFKDFDSQNNTQSKQSTAQSFGVWKCPKCGIINSDNVGTCGCGEVKPK